MYKMCAHACVCSSVRMLSETYVFVRVKLLLLSVLFVVVFTARVNTLLLVITALDLCKAVLCVQLHSFEYNTDNIKSTIRSLHITLPDRVS